MMRILMRQLQKIPRSALRATMMAIWARQGRVCPICKKPIDISVMGRSSNYVVDHCHESGEIRGVLHRSCNAAEGKVANAAGQWGAKSTKKEDVIVFLESLITYWKNAAKVGTGMMYPDHKTPEEKKAAALLKQRKAYAKRKAAEKAGNGKV